MIQSAPLHRVGGREALPITPDIQHLLGRLHHDIEHRWSDGGEFVATMCRYAVTPSGKLFRPILLLEACMAVGGDPYHVLPAAIGTEYGHVASLIHDDIIDSDAMRRGKASVYHKFGVNNAILVGDALIFQLFLCLAECKATRVQSDRIVEALRVVATSGIDLCRGQVLEDQLCGDLESGVELYFKMIRLKTASFFRGAAESGAILGGGTSEQVALMAEYGENLGIAFQIIDDLLPYTSSIEVAGKSATSDIKNKRLTLPVLYAYQHGSTSDRDTIRSIFAGDYSIADSYQKLRYVLIRASALDTSRDIALNYAHIARSRLDQLSISPSNLRLRTYIDLAVDRIA